MDLIDNSKTLVVVMTADSMDMHLSQLWETVKNREAWHAVDHRVTKESDTNSATK